MAIDHLTHHSEQKSTNRDLLSPSLLSVVSICNRCFNSVRVCTKTPHLYLLALARLNRQRVCILPSTRQAHLPPIAQISEVYARMLNTVGSWMAGRYVTIEMICFKISSPDFGLYLGLRFRLSVFHHSFQSTYRPGIVQTGQSYPGRTLPPTILNFIIFRKTQPTTSLSFCYGTRNSLVANSVI